MKNTPCTSLHFAKMSSTARKIAQQQTFKSVIACAVLDALDHEAFLGTLEIRTTTQNTIFISFSVAVLHEESSQKRYEAQESYLKTINAVSKNIQNIVFNNEKCKDLAFKNIGFEFSKGFEETCQEEQKIWRSDVDFTLTAHDNHLKDIDSDSGNEVWVPIKNESESR